MAGQNLAAASRDTDTTEARLRMVNGQLLVTGVNDAAVLAAFLAVPRERFVAEAFRAQAYLDRDAPAAGAATRKLLAPRTLGRLLQSAELKAGERALDVGGGAGYTAALLVELGCEVTMLESDAGALTAAREALAGAPDVNFVQGPLSTGAPKGPFDLIVINGAFETTPGELIDRLSESGRLVGLDGSAGAQRGVVIAKTAAGYSKRAVFNATAAALPEFQRARDFAF